jgi:hypothetical protein
MSRSTTALRCIVVLGIGLAFCSSSAMASVRLLDTNINWTTIGSNVQFHLRFDNPGAVPTQPVAGSLTPQSFGAFLPNSGPPRSFDVPVIMPFSFFDVFLEIPLAQLPQNPPNVVPIGGAGDPCPQGDHWDGNVDVIWNGLGGQGEVLYHEGEIKVCPGAGCSLIHVATGCAGLATWSITGLCSGFSAQLMNEDQVTPAPNPLPPAWSGWVCVTALTGTPVPSTCCFAIRFVCAGQVSTVNLCATTCNCIPTGPGPLLGTVEWATLTGTSTVRFHMRWDNPSLTQATSPISGAMHSQPFGVFQPVYGTIGVFEVPPIAPDSFFDVFFEVPMSELPPSQQPVSGKRGDDAKGTDDEPGPCAPGDHWNGNVDIVWTGAAGGGQVNKHFGELKVCPGVGASLIHIPALVCPSGTGNPWSIMGLCPGFGATLVEEDMTTPSPNPVPPGWTGYIRVTAALGTAIPDTCCFKVTFFCDGVPGVIDMCAITCDCGPSGIDLGTGAFEFGIRGVVPNPTGGPAAIDFVLSLAERARLEIFDVAGHRVRTLADDRFGVGAHTAMWDGLDARGNTATPGVYFVRLVSGERTTSYKFVLRRLPGR